MAMQTSDEGLMAIMEREGCKLTAYPDPATHSEPWTIGVGHTGGVRSGDTCTKEQALEWLRDDAETAERCVNNSVKVIITQNQFDSIVSFVFNLGCSALRNSTLLRKLNDGDDAGAAAEFEKWSNANGKFMQGLHTRRLSEREQFLS